MSIVFGDFAASVTNAISRVASDPGRVRVSVFPVTLSRPSFAKCSRTLDGGIRWPSSISETICHVPSSDSAAAWLAAATGASPVR